MDFSITLLFRDFALLGAEWVMWLLIGLSLLSIAIMIERWRFFASRKIDMAQLVTQFNKRLDEGDYQGVEKLLDEKETMETQVVSYGLAHRDRGPKGVEELMTGLLGTERLRYERGLNVLGTVGNNAPFIGLFGTVLGIIGAFANLGEGSAEAAQQVMAAISEALVATGVGLLVAIPAVIAFNIFKSKTKSTVARTELLSKSLLSHLEAKTYERETERSTKV